MCLLNSEVRDLVDVRHTHVIERDWLIRELRHSNSNMRHWRTTLGHTVQNAFRRHLSC